MLRAATSPLVTENMLEAETRQFNPQVEGEMSGVEVSPLDASGVIIDTTLADELSNPGSDQRCGVNLICRPSPEVTALASSIQRELKRLEPDQYYYEESALHLTLVEACHSKSFIEARKIAEQLGNGMEGILASLSAPRIASSNLGIDPRGCALMFSPVDGGLDRVRGLLTERLHKLGIPVDPRYPQRSAHVTLLRYIRPLKVDSKTWWKRLRSVNFRGAVNWDLSSLWLTCGANWYGTRSRITERGPYSLLPVP
jgi:2'-5' RNA ligase